MRIRTNLNKLTYVLLLIATQVGAVPHIDSPPEAEKSANETDVGDVSPERVENISISVEKRRTKVSEALVQRFDKRDYYYPYRHEFEAHVGAVLGVKDSSDDDDLMNPMLGFSYMLPRVESPKWVLGADLSFVGHGHLYAEKRFIYNEKGSFRPFYHYGLMHKLVPEDKFASLSNMKNYLLRGGVGFADILNPPRSVQLELDIAVGSEDLLIIFYYGYAWGI